MVLGAMVLAKGVHVGTLFFLNACTIQCKSSIAIAKILVESISLESKLPIKITMLWYQRLDHIHENGPRFLKKKGMVYGLNNFSLLFEFCKHCMYGKQNHVQFYSSSHKSYGLLDLIHFDVFGPIKIPSILRALYYVSFIDDYSRRTWVYFIKSKSKVFN